MIGEHELTLQVAESYIQAALMFVAHSHGVNRSLHTLQLRRMASSGINGT